MVGVGWIGAIIIGIIAGWLAEKIMGRRHGLLINLVVGLVGGLIGAFVANLLNLGGSGWIFSLIFSTIGACILLFIVGLFSRPRA